jgi:dipeptidyl aminopeptidase/acylaminoacyl peptidase
MYVAPSVAPDGNTIALLGHGDLDVFPCNSMVGLLDVGGGTPRWISSELDRTWLPFPYASKPHWMPDGSLLASVEDRGNLHVYRVSDAAAPELVLGGARVVTGLSVAGGTIAFTATSADRPAELSVLVDGTERQVSSVTGAFHKGSSPRVGEHFLAQSGDVEVDAWIFTPPDFDDDKSYPMLLNIHGGPFTQYGNFFFDEAQMQAAAGFVVVLSNPRGGSGRGTAWGQAILGPKHRIPGSGWGGVDYDDVMAVVDAALTQYPFIDSDRLGVLGGSYGGYMTSWIVTHTNRFKAACSERAVNNVANLEHGSDIAGVFRVQVGPTHLDDPAEYQRMSPITYVDALETPLLIIHSDDDLRCPVDQADQLFLACEILGKEVEYYRFPGETHELSRSGSPAHRVQRADIIHEFFRRHLMENGG